MKHLSFIIVAFLMVSLGACSQDVIKLNQPNKSRKTTLMTALANRHSDRNFTKKELSTQDLSDLMWCAFGINRTDGKRTAASAMNAQDIEIYAFMEKGIYLYDAKANVLNRVKEGDSRALFTQKPRPGDKKMTQTPVTPPLILLLVSDVSKFGQMGTKEVRLQMGCIDAGLISQNISLFCCANGMATVPRAGMDKASIAKVLNIADSETIILNQPVSYVAK